MEALTLKHYKEPLLPIPEALGFGFYGAIEVSLDGEQIRCHLCGHLFGNLGLHIYHKHEMTVSEYREKFQLSPTTALVSESVRQKLKESAFEHFARFSPEQKAKWLEKARAARSKKQPKEVLEAKNKKGTCPDQLLDRIKKCAEDIGHTPTKNEFIDYCGSQRYVHLIYKTFGSFTKAVKFAELHPVEKKRVSTSRIYDNDELLEYLQIFWQENQKIPTATDCRRGLIPDQKVYDRHFGSLPKARLLAGITEIPSRWAKTLETTNL